MKRLWLGIIGAAVLVSAGVAVAVAASSSTTPPPKIGEKAPAWTLPSDRGGNVSLTDFQGKKVVVMAFFPKDETPGCTKEMQAFSKDAGKFEAAGAAVFGISRDTLDAHQKFRVHCALDVPLLSDNDAKVAETYGVVMPVVGLFQRKLFLIDKTGVIRQVVDGMPDNAELLTDIAKISE